MLVLVITFLTFLSTISLAFAENHLLLFGGGGEPQNETTVFDNGVSKLGVNLKKSKWSYDVSFNGGHRDTEKILQTQLTKTKSPITAFTQNNFTKMIEDYSKKILNNEIKSGDQLLIIMYAHGAKSNSKELTHSVALSGGVARELDNLSGAQALSLDKLQEIVKLTNERGIKLGIVDLSCHSGATLALKKNAPHTCIVAASGPKHYSYTRAGSFTENFLEMLKPGVSLEQTFLEARRFSNDTSFPMISTGPNDKIVSEIYEGITPYLYYYKPDEDKLTPYILENDSLALICKRENNFNNLLSQISALDSVLSSTNSRFNADQLKTLLINYKRNQDEILTSTKELGFYKLNNTELFSIPANSRDLLSKFKIHYTWRELLEFDVEKRITEYENYKKAATSKNQQNDHQLVLNFLAKVNEKKQLILKENPRLLTYKKYTTTLVKSLYNTEEKAKKIANQEKILYEELYNRSQQINKEDPCKQIIF